MMSRSLFLSGTSVFVEDPGDFYQVKRVRVSSVVHPPSWLWIPEKMRAVVKLTDTIQRGQ
jgi:hypothetical protein